MGEGLRSFKQSLSGEMPPQHPASSADLAPAHADTAAEHRSAIGD
jgi:hypothetical protein